MVGGEIHAEFLSMWIFLHIRGPQGNPQFPRNRESRASAAKRPEP